MKKVIGLAVIALGIFLEVMWLGVCFGTIIVGILLLIFAPSILFFPFNFFLVLGLSIMGVQPKNGSTRFKYQSHSRSNHNFNQNNYRQTSNTLNEYYEVLESKPTDTLATIKSNYRRLIKEYHYDSMASKDLPEDILNFAKEKTQKLNEAYSAIKTDHK